MGKLLRKAMVASAGSVLSALWGSREKARRASISVANGTERAAEKAWTALTACVPSLHAETRGGAIASYGKPEQRLVQLAGGTAG